MKLLSIGLAIMLAVSLGFPAYAEVRFGKNVRVGGHDFSNQTFNSKRRGKVYLYEGKPQRRLRLAKRQEWRARESLPSADEEEAEVIYAVYDRRACALLVMKVASPSFV